MGRRARILYTTKTFSEVWTDYDAFVADYNAIIPLLNGALSPLKTANILATYYLLYARYADAPIICTDDYQWKVKMMTVISTYGPTWQKKKDIQIDLRTLTQDELLQGAKQIYNHAFNPSTEPSTNELEELTHINEQNVTNNKKAKMEAYAILWANLHVDATDEYLNKFNRCFSRFVGDQFPTIYVNTYEEEEDEGE